MLSISQQSTSSSFSKIIKKDKQRSEIFRGHGFYRIVIKNTMKNISGKSKKNEKDAPVVDGDTRPDTPGNENSAARKNRTAASIKSKLTSNRTGDVNSLEDFKDTKN
jgi:hypothetical protein